MLTRSSRLAALVVAAPAKSGASALSAVLPRQAGGFHRALSSAAAANGFRYSSPVSSLTPEEANTLKGLKGRSLLRVDDLTIAELKAVLNLSHFLKRLTKTRPGGTFKPVLAGESLAMIFQKRSTRTRVSSETGANLLGMQSLFLGSEDVQLGVNESVRDTSTVLSRFNSILLARVFGHDVVADMARYSRVPVINALSNSHHPLQALADYMTIQEQFGLDITGLTVTWIGDGNNVLNDLMLAGAMSGCSIRVATPPKEHEPYKDVVADARAILRKQGSKNEIKLFNDPKEALFGADVIVTDVWVSMGFEKEKAARLRTFADYKITMEMVRAGQAKPGWKFMHCLPRHPEEVDDEVFYSERSIVFDEAENRMWTVMAVLVCQLGRVQKLLDLAQSSKAISPGGVKA